MKTNKLSAAEQRKFKQSIIDLTLNMTEEMSKDATLPARPVGHRKESYTIDGDRCAAVIGEKSRKTILYLPGISEQVYILPLTSKEKILAFCQAQKMPNVVDFYALPAETMVDMQLLPGDKTAIDFGIEIGEFETVDGKYDVEIQKLMTRTLDFPDEKEM